jgi:hypothetical protein
MTIQLDKGKLAKLLALTSSPVDGEALAAVRKAHHLIAKAGITWPQLLEVDDPVLEPEPEHVRQAKELLSLGKGIITDWERRFLIGIMAFKTPSSQQLGSLGTIRAKVTAAAS